MEIAVRKIFKLKSSRLVNSTIQTLQLVVANIKPTWLIDSFKCSSDQLLLLITGLDLQQILCVIQVCDDLLVANREGLNKIIVARNISNVLVIDVSPRLPAPIVIKETNSSFNSVIKHIKYIDFQTSQFLSNSSSVDNFNLCAGCDFPLELTFVFGWLLGYPFLYYNSDHLHTHSNNLSNIPLKVFKSLYCGFSFLSFSIPLSVLEEYAKEGKDLLQQLNQRMLCSCDKTEFNMIEIHETVQTLDIVAM